MTNCDCAKHRRELRRSTQLATGAVVIALGLTVWVVSVLVAYLGEDARAEAVKADQFQQELVTEKGEIAEAESFGTWYDKYRAGMKDDRQEDLPIQPGPPPAVDGTVVGLPDVRPYDPERDGDTPHPVSALATKEAELPPGWEAVTPQQVVTGD